MISTKKYNTIIIGSGISGLNLARKLAQAGQEVFLASKEAVTEGSSKYAQGGIAVVSPLNPEDKLEDHIQDTIKAGKGLCKEEVVKTILELGWSKVEELMKLGVEFDKHFNLEGSHGYKRIMHVGDSTGRAVMKPLLDNVSRNLKISISQGTEAYSLIKNTNNDRVCGVQFVTVSGEEFDVLADSVVLASGGLAALFEDYTCPSILTGDGIALAYDAGAKIENLEFIQFHPTVFKTKEGKNFLISEALRGAGATLRNSKSELFADKYHPDAELATRDIVSRAIFSEMRATNSDYVFIDARHLQKDFLQKEFPNIYGFCLANGYDLSKDLVPVKPAAHYSIGGIKTDVHGRTNLPGLYAIGECASNGLHGANRLASNSLLECIVVPELLSQAILEEEANLTETDFNLDYCSNYKCPSNYDEQIFSQNNLKTIREIMSKSLSVERKLKSILVAIKFIESLPESKEKTTALLIAKSASLRKESRGVHYRVDCPKYLKTYERSTILSKEQVALRQPIRIKV